MVDVIRRRVEDAKHKLACYLFDRMVRPVFREAVRYSGVPSAKVRCDVCRGPFPSHVHVCDECSARALRPAVLRRLVRMFGKSVYVAVVNAEMVD